MATSRVPYYQKLATQIPEIRKGGRWVFAGPVVQEVAAEHAEIAAVVAVGADETDAAALSSAPFQTVTGANAAKGVILPLGVAGQSITVFNSGAAVLKVYPAAGGTINAAAANAAYAQAANATVTFNASGPLTWVTS